MSRPGDVVWAGGKTWQRGQNVYDPSPWTPAGVVTDEIADTGELKTYPDFMWLVRNPTPTYPAMVEQSYNEGREKGYRAGLADAAESLNEL